VFAIPSQVILAKVAARVSQIEPAGFFSEADLRAQVVAAPEIMPFS